MEQLTLKQSFIKAIKDNVVAFSLYAGVFFAIVISLMILKRLGVE